MAFYDEKNPSAPMPPPYPATSMYYGAQPKSRVVVGGPVPVVVTQRLLLGPRPMALVCPNCRHQIVTRTASSPGFTAWILGILLCVVGCWCLSCVPCCVDQLKDTQHECPNCNQFIGTYRGA